MTDLVIEIDMDGRCAECGEMGTTQAGLCLKCLAKRVVGRIREISRREDAEGEAE